MPNYVALVAGSSEGYVFDDLPGLDFPNKDASVTTIVDILEAGLISWGAYLENLPFVGYRAVDYTSRNYNTPGGAPYNYYARRHSGLHKFDSVMTNQTRVNRLRTMNNFADDLVNGTLPAWSYITPNVLNDVRPRRELARPFSKFEMLARSDLVAGTRHHHHLRRPMARLLPVQHAQRHALQRRRNPRQPHARPPHL